MAEKKLKNELNTDYQLVGIASSLKEYKLCYLLNNLLDCSFKKLSDLTFEPTDRSRQAQFSVFKAGDEKDMNQFWVFANKRLSDVLLPEIANFDFIIKIEGRYEEVDLRKLVESIKLLADIVMVAEIPLMKIKSKERLEYREEIPVLKLMKRKLIK